ncbi:MAG: 16S rRNA (cytosine(1402)-N(4))-methyltransferase RsmH [Candidatus Gracilibacteria bacterium]
MKKKIKAKPSKKAQKKSLMKKIVGRFLKKKKLAPKPVKKHQKKAAKKNLKKRPAKKITHTRKSVSKAARSKNLKKSPKKAKQMKVLKKKVKNLKKIKKPIRRSPPKAIKKQLKLKKSLQKTAQTTHHSKKPAPVQKIAVSAPQKAVQATETSTSAAFSHEPVMMHEVLENLAIGDKKVVVDGTLGLGGHSRAMLEQMAPDAQLVAFDVDDDNLTTARNNLVAFGDRVFFVRSNFGNLQEELKNLGIKKVDALLLDLGLSSPQVDNPAKGFSFLREGPLDMRFDKNQPLTAAEVINGYSLNELMRIFFEYGEERFSRKIATEIVRRRKARSFKTTTELANFIEKLIGRQGHIHPATRIFQALRIEVNHELDVLLRTLQQAVEVLSKGGRIAVIAYHSLEDRVVKQFFKDCAREYVNEPDKLTTTHLEPTLEIVTKKPLVPTDAEIAKNPRARSAKLRVAQKL